MLILSNFTDENLNIASAVSYVTIGDKIINLAWLETAKDSWTCTNKIGTFFLNRKVENNKTTFTSKVTLNSSDNTFVYTMLSIPQLNASHIQPAQVAMGSSNGILLDKTELTSFKSFNTCVFTFNGKDSLLLSNPLAQSQLVYYEGIIEDKKIKNLNINHDVRHSSLKEITFAPVTFEIGKGHNLLIQYAEDNKTRENIPVAPVPGWNSWDFYRWTVTEEEVLNNARFIHNDPVLSKYIKRIIVDDGWQYCYGEWEANSLFPSGMEYLAKEIRKMNFEAGLWFAPCIVEPASPIAQIHPEMLACSEGGQPCLAYECMKRVGLILDPTVEKSRKFLRDTFDKYCQRGFTYFKLDFLRWILEARRFADMTVPRSQLVNRLMDPIIEGVNNRAVILGCNYPFMTGDKYINDCRISADIHADWRNIKINAATAAGRFWMNKRLWNSDPDFSLCRGVETSDYPDKVHPNFVFVKPEDNFNPVFNKTYANAKHSELEVLLSIVLTTSGAINLSDNLPLLNERGLELARKVVSAKPGKYSAIPLDLFTTEQPSLFLQELNCGGRFLAINWEDEAKEITIPDNAIEAMPSQATNFWTGKETNVTKTIVLAPHSCCLLEW